MFRKILCCLAAFTMLSVCTACGNSAVGSESVAAPSPSRAAVSTQPQTPVQQEPASAKTSQAEPEPAQSQTAPSQPQRETAPQESSSQAEIEAETGQEPDMQKKTLVVYFSSTGTTEPLAEYAAEILGADLYEIVPETPYTDADLAYYTGGRADQEQDDADARPAISGSVENMGEYDTILLGYPIWHGQAPRIVSTFLESYDLTGKTILPFCTSHSSGIGSSDTNLHNLASDANWLSGRRFAGGATREEIQSWLNNALAN